MYIYACCSCPIWFIQVRAFSLRASRVRFDRSSRYFHFELVLHSSTNERSNKYTMRYCTINSTAFSNPTNNQFIQHAAAVPVLLFQPNKESIHTACSSSSSNIALIFACSAKLALQPCLEDLITLACEPQIWKYEKNENYNINTINNTVVDSTVLLISISGGETQCSMWVKPPQNMKASKRKKLRTDISFLAWNCASWKLSTCQIIWSI